MTKAKRLARLAEERTSKVEYIALNRSKKFDGKPGFYDGRPVGHRFIVVGKELADFIASEQAKQQQQLPTGGFLKPDEEGMVSIYDSNT